MNPTDDPTGEVEGEIELPCGHRSKLVPIPSELHSVYDDGPFRRCTVCDSRLDTGCLYEIQKVFRGDEVLFEMALCQACGEQLCREFSEASMEALKCFLFTNFKPGAESRHCNFCGIPRPLLDGCTVVGACTKSSLILPAIVLCETCGEELQSRISPRTRETQEDFVRLNFPGVPGDLDLNPTLGGMFA